MHRLYPGPKFSKKERAQVNLSRFYAISQIFAVRLDKRLKGKLATVIDRIEHGHRVFRAY
jgi:hypothetical protein